MKKKTKQRPSRAARWSPKASPPAPSPNEWFISGLNGVRECLRSPRVTVLRVWGHAKKLRGDDLALFRPYGDRFTELQGDTPFGPAIQGVAALVRPVEEAELDTVLDDNHQAGKTPLLVALDQVEDPMNLGQILRTCEGAGVSAVLLPRHRSAHLTQTVAQISQGAFAWLPVVSINNLRQTVDELKNAGFWIYGCDAGEGSKPWHQADMTSPTMLVMGAEGKGLRRLTRESCDGLLHLPMAGYMESLNVGAACSAFVFEAIRQRTSQEQ